MRSDLKISYIGDKVVLLTCGRSAREEMRAVGLDGNYTIDLVNPPPAAEPLMKILQSADHPKLVRIFQPWLESARQESAIAGRICVVWMPSPAPRILAALRDAVGDALLEIPDHTAADALRRLEPHLLPRPDTAGKVFAVCSIRNGGLELLPHWLEHYTKLGVDRILLGIFEDVSPQVKEEIAAFSQRWPFVCFTQTFTGQDEHAHEDQRRSACRVAGAVRETWILHSDLDELHEFPAPLPEVIAAAQAQGIELISGHFVDRVAPGGELPPIQPTPSLWEQFPIQCQLTAKVLHGWTHKMMLARFNLPAGVGHHVPNGPHESRIPLGQAGDYRVHHFKWHAELLTRIAWSLKQPTTNPIWKIEAMRFLAWLRSNGGRIQLTGELSQAD